MTLYLMRCVAAGTTLFSVYDESGALCCTAQTLSGLFGDGFQITGTLNDREAEIYISPMLLPHIRMFTVQVGGQRRAQLRMMLDGSVRTLRVDGAPCTVLGRPMTGEYTVRRSDGQILYTQQLQSKSVGRTAFTLTIPDGLNAPTAVGIAVCLSMTLPAARPAWAPASV